MTNPQQYTPGPASGARIHKDGDAWTLVLVRDLRHAPEKVWKALTDPAELRAWAPFDADASMGRAGNRVHLTTVAAPAPHVSETTIQRAEGPRLLEYQWGGGNIRWELEPRDGGTRLTLWHNIDRKFIAMGAAGWHICLDVMDRMLGGHAVERIVGMSAMKFDGWQRLHAEYAKELGVAMPTWSSGAGA